MALINRFLFPQRNRQFEAGRKSMLKAENNTDEEGDEEGEEEKMKLVSYVQ